jgi:hypothetical protein
MNAARRLYPDRSAPIENAIHRRDAKAGFTGDVGEGGASSSPRFDGFYHRLIGS